MSNTAILALENGQLFKGTAIGAAGLSVGEVVFNTSITGYQEILTDPSYARQIITLTHPHIGNTGVNVEDEESTEIFASGLVIRDLPLMASNWRKEQPLDQYLESRGVVAIAEIDTHKLTRYHPLSWPLQRISHHSANPHLSGFESVCACLSPQ